MNQEPESPSEFWDRVYADPLYGSRATPSHGAVLSEFGLLRARKISTVLEVGCGRGIVLGELSRHGFVSVGTEVAATLFASSLKDEEVFPLSVEAMREFKDDLFDLSIAVNVLDHLPSVQSVEAGLREMARVSRVAVTIVVNGDPLFQTITRPNGWWVDSLRTIVAPRIVSCKEHKTGYACATAWKLTP